jgi:hypothetical protein
MIAAAAVLSNDCVLVGGDGAHDTAAGVAELGPHLQPPPQVIGGPRQTTITGALPPSQ